MYVQKWTSTKYVLKCQKLKMFENILDDAMQQTKFIYEKFNIIKHEIKVHWNEKKKKTYIDIKQKMKKIWIIGNQSQQHKVG